ncbi:MAG: S1 RNA-binding domain-containing protein [Ruminococcus sp.]|nr:S1 RNA-binding domain-containing protein [Ruminococcus sp.]
MQQLEIGKIYTGKVKGIAQYGAFIDIDGGGTGMVHISEIVNTFVNEIRDHLTEGQEVRVKVIGINEQGKVSLSIKKASDDNGEKEKRPFRRDGGKERERRKPNIYEPKRSIPQSEMTFEDMMSHFKQSSEEKIGDLKRNNDRKNGARRK